MSLLKDTEEIIVRDLGAMKEELKLTSPELLWKAEPGITNSVGTLSYHICGNLRHFIGAVLGEDGYIRNREAEFNTHDLSLDDLLASVDQTIDAVKNAFIKLSEKDLEREMPDTPPQHKGRTTGFFLIQLCCHLSRHRGQLDYLRRISAAKN
jgi:uncharacterized damage-inducible protein DinB